MASETDSNLPLSDAHKLAQLIGISEEDPLAYYHVSDENQLREVFNFSQTLSPTSRAEFCALYLVKLVRAIETPPHQQPRPFVGGAARVLELLLDQPLWRGHFVRTSPYAADLLANIIRILVRICPRHLDSSPGNEDARALGFLSFFRVIESLINSALVHGSVSPVNLVLPPSVRQDFLWVCQQHLASRSLTKAKEGRDHPAIILLKELLQTLPMVLGVEGVGELVITRRVRENSTSKGALACELTVYIEDAEGHLVDSCARWYGKGGAKLKFCSICKSVAYCCPEHQRADWKRHKPVCFAPRW